jgi:competence protein ComEC
MKIKGCIALIILLSVILSGCWPSPSASSGAPNSLQVYFIDVGQGDAEILRYGNSTMLIDAGTNASTNSLISDIRSLGINRFDFVVATHPHEDHIGGLDAVIDQFPIDKIIMPKVAANTNTFEEVLKSIHNEGLTVTAPVSGSSFNLGPAVCSIIAPNSQKYEELNNYSIVIRVVHGNNSFLFPGDAQVATQEEMLSLGYSLKSDVLKIAHHGSESSNSLKFLGAVSPRYAVIEAGLSNDYGLPHKATLDKLRALGAIIYRTDINGTITFNSDGSDILISTER